MRHLIRIVALRHLAASPGRGLRTLAGVTLGVALVLAFDVVSGCVMASLRAGVDELADETALVVGARGGVDEALLEPLRQVPGVSVAGPIIQDVVRDVATDTALTVLAVDTLGDERVRAYADASELLDDAETLAFLNDPRGVLITRRYASRARLARGATLTLETAAGRDAFHVRGVLTERGPVRAFGGDLLVMDVYAAQAALGRGRRFDRIDVVPTASTDLEALRERLREALQGRASLGRAEQPAAALARTMERFRRALSLAMLVALLVGGSVVYRALAVAVSHRVGEAGILRAVGATRRQLLVLFASEGALLGSLGSVLGLGLGLVLGGATLAALGATLPELDLPLLPASVRLDVTRVALALSVGLATSIVAALVPALRVGVVSPAAALRTQADAVPPSPVRVGRARLVVLALAVTVVVVAARLALHAVTRVDDAHALQAR